MRRPKTISANELDAILQTLASIARLAGTAAVDADARRQIQTKCDDIYTRLLRLPPA
ncbi:MAG: hypothetical protein AB7O32_00605 [Vicinamibacterales bacterium]